MSMTSEPTRSLEVFYSYAHEDERLRRKLETQLSLLKRRGVITAWYDRKIAPGKKWANEIDTHLNNAQLILLLVSPDFMDSDYCYGLEMERALERHEAGEARVIPIILRAVDWSEAPFGKLQVLPKNAKPVTQWHDEDSAFLNVAEGIRKAVETVVTTHDSQRVPPKDFLISYHSADRLWAEWIAWQLEEEGYSVMLQALDFLLGSNFVEEMQKASTEAERSIVVLSPDYLNVLDTQPEWAVALKRDQASQQDTLVPVHVRECRDRLRGLLALLSYIDLVGQDEPIARETLLTGVRLEGNRPRIASNFLRETHHLVTEQPRFPASFPAIWNVPYPRNPFFTGREDVLQYMHQTLALDKTAALGQPLAISGLGGIGKTQTAIEYAYRYRSDYQAVLWVQAETRETLIADFVNIAHLLNLSERDAQDQSRAIHAVMRWLRDHIDWLLILDNADDLALVRDFLPSTSGGHFLLTTRAQAMGRIGEGVYLQTMEPEEGALFLLRRAKFIKSDGTLEDASETDRAKAREISEVMGGLPLALDQAGAYIEETGSGLSGYLERYRTQRALLLRRRGEFILGHPEPVTATWSLSFEKVEQSNVAAAELLRLFAFLYADAIPEEIITEGAPELGPVLQEVATNPLEMDYAIAELRKYSLVRRNPENQTLTIHRLVQAVLKDRMDEYTQRQWAERTVRAVNRVFPDVEFATWYRCQRYLPHAQTCAALIQQWDMTFPEAARLLNQAGFYLEERAQYAQAEPLIQQALMIHERVLGTEHLDTALSLNNLAYLYESQGKYAQAEPLYQRVLAIHERVMGPDHPSTADTLNNLARLYNSQGKYAQAEPLIQRALAIYEKTLGPEHPGLASALINLANLYQTQGKFSEAEPLYQQALVIREQALGPTHPDTALSLSNLATLYYNQGKYAEALPLYQRALAIRERALGAEHPDIALSLNNLAMLYKNRGMYEQAEPLFQRALAIFEKTLGPEHPYVATALENYADLLRETKREAQATNLKERVRTIREKRAQEYQVH